MAEESLSLLEDQPIPAPRPLGIVRGLSGAFSRVSRKSSFIARIDLLGQDAITDESAGTLCRTLEEKLRGAEHMEPIDFSLEDAVKESILVVSRDRSPWERVAREKLEHQSIRVEVTEVSISSKSPLEEFAEQVLNRAVPFPLIFPELEERVVTVTELKGEETQGEPAAESLPRPSPLCVRPQRSFPWQDWFEKNHLPRFLPYAQLVGLTRKEVFPFLSMFYSLYAAGLPLARALTVMANETPNIWFRRILRDVRTDLLSGFSLSRSLERHPHTFPPLFVYLIRCGELSDSLARTLSTLIRYEQRRNRHTHHLRQALTYPAIVLGGSLIFILWMGQSVFSRLIPVFTEARMELPLLTRTLILISQTLGNPIIMGIAGIITAFLAWHLVTWLRIPVTKAMILKFLYSVPTLGSFLHKSSLCGIISSLAVLSETGYELPKGMEIIASGCGNPIAGDALRSVVRTLRSGVPLTNSFALAGFFPKLAVEMVHIGEETGRLSSMLNRLAEIYEEDTELTMNGVLNVLEPVLLGALGVVVGLVTYGAFGPLLSLIRHVNL
jgi:type IV pilus assembly protein PilC